MGFKDLFINSEETAKDKPKIESVKESSKMKFPTTEIPETQTETPFKSVFNFGKTTPAFTPSVSGGVNPEHISKAIDRYQKGFESLNQPGFDFFEYYQTVIDSGVDNPMAFTMAFKMAKTMDKTITKEALISQSEFYIAEINKSSQDTVTKGSSKKQELLTHKEMENQALVQELANMKEQMEAMKVQIQDRENKLKAIGSKYEPQINEIDSKLAANEIAKNQIMQSIEQVKQGINVNIK